MEDRPASIVHRKTLLREFNTALEALMDAVMNSEDAHLEDKVEKVRDAANALREFGISIAVEPNGDLEFQHFTPS